MAKILSLDIGQKRIGVAIAEGKVVAPYGVVASANLLPAVREILTICRKEDVAKIIIGLPKSKNNFEIDKIHKFAIELTKNSNLEIIYVDETLTSKEAERMLKNQKIDPISPQYKQEIDKLAAKMILEQYLAKINV